MRQLVDLINTRAPRCGASRAEQKCTLWLVTEGSKSGLSARGRAFSALGGQEAKRS